MRKITVALASLMIAFSVIFAATPAFADVKECPAGSLQGEDVKYLTTDATETATPTDSMSFDATTGKLAAGTILPSQAQCNMHGKDIKGSDLISSIDGLINVVLGVLGVVAVVVVILGGVTFVTSAGDPNKVKRAKDTILYGIIGLVIALLAYAITNFVLKSVIKP